MTGALLVQTAIALTVAGVGGGNALTLPAQRHLVRVEHASGASWLLAVQQDRKDGHGLVFFRSDDEARSWRYYAPIQGDGGHRDTADVVRAPNNDLLVAYAYEGPELSGSDAHDVFFQRWKYDGEKDWVAGAALRVFDSGSSETAYSRAEVAVDSRGRIWVQAWKMESDGVSSTAVMAVSNDGGAHFQTIAPLAYLHARGGGRLLHLGSRLLLVYDCHDAGTAAKFRLHDDGAAPGDWSAQQTAFTEGIYHGAALSAVADGAGGAHLVYKDEAERLLYRRFDGSGFGPPVVVEENGDWALQPAVTRVDGSSGKVIIFYNRPIELNESYELLARRINGSDLGEPVVVDDTETFKGYLASPEVVPAKLGYMPCAYGNTPDAEVGGVVSLQRYWF